MKLRPLVSVCMTVMTLIASAATVIFDGNGGLINGEARYSYENAYLTVGQVIEAPSLSAITPPQGYVFDKWHYGSADGEVAEVLICYNLTTLYVATYRKLPTYTIAFNANGGQGSMANMAMVYGTSANLTANVFTRTGYAFNGWATSTSGDVVYGDKAQVSDLTTVDGATVTLYAHWKANTFKVTFDANGGGTPSFTETTVTYDRPYGDLATSSRTGYTFAGWYTAKSGGSKVTADTTVKLSANQTLYAHWTANTYTVTVTGDYGGSCPAYTFSASSQTKTVTLPVRTGYKISGWSVSGANGGTPTASGSTLTIPANVYGNLTLTPSWSVITYTVTVSPNGGSGGSCDGYTISASQQTKAITLPTRTGYTISAWTVTGATSGSPSASGTTLTIPANAYGDLTLKPTWSANGYSVRFSGSGSTGGSMPDESMTYGQAKALTANAFTRTGYAFDGWATSTSGAKAYNDQQIVSNLTEVAGGTYMLYARWLANKYVVEFNANGGQGTMSDLSLAYDRSTNLTANAFTRTGYTFDGWATNPAGEVIYRDRASVKNLTALSGGKVSLYAHWTPNAYTVGFDGGGAPGGWMSPQDLTYDVPANLASNVFVWTGHAFTGWIGSDGKSYADGAPVSNLTAVAGDRFTMTAQWTANGYTVTLDPDGGEGGDVSVAVVYDAELPDIVVPTRRGFTFLGYFSTRDGNVKYYDANGKGVRTWNKTGELTLYAHWKANVYTVCYEAFGGAGSMDHQTFTYSEVQMLRPNAFVRAGCTFAGWKSSGVIYRNGETVSNLTDRADVYVVLHARWQSEGETPSVVTNELSAAVGLADLELSAADGGWCVSTNTGYSGDCVRSVGKAGNPYAKVRMSLTVPGAGTLAFKWMMHGNGSISGGSTGNSRMGILRLFVDETETVKVNSVSGDSSGVQFGWEMVERTFDGGPHVVTWEYEHWNFASYADYGQVDEIIWTSSGEPSPAEIFEVPDQDDVRDEPPGAALFFL